MGKTLRAETFVESSVASSSEKRRPSRAKGAAPENRATKDACLEKLTENHRPATWKVTWRWTENASVEEVALHRACAEEVSLQSFSGERAWPQQATCRGHRRGARGYD